MHLRIEPLGFFLKLVIIVILLVIAVISRSQADELECPQDFHLIEEDIGKTEAYRIYQSQTHNGDSEIQYLINLVKYSPLYFDRNGKLSSGDIAAEILRIKIKTFRDEVETTEDFIEKIASYSRHSGKEYQIVDSNGASCPIKRVLYMELEKLRVYEEQINLLMNIHDQSISAMKSGIIEGG